MVSLYECIANWSFFVAILSEQASIPQEQDDECPIPFARIPIKLSFYVQGYSVLYLIETPDFC
jgi:hypothetical protein